MSKPSRRNPGRPGQTPSGSETTGATPRPPGTPESPSGSTSRPPSSGGTTPRAGTNRQSTGPVGTPRTGRRSRSTYQHQSFSERHRGTIVGLAAISAVALIGVFVVYSASRPLFQCSNIGEPTPTASPLAGASPAPGYVQDDMGRLHVPSGEVVKYTYCPPASGNHYQAVSLGPIPARFYGVNDKTLPEGWIHNLEHGALVLLYRGDSDGATTEGQKALRAFFDDFPNSPVCNITPGTSQGPVITRFDEMATPFAALVWGRVLPLQTLDTAAILDFYKIFGERTNPEQQCAPPSASPSVAPSGSPSASPSASPSVAPSGSTAPSASGSAAPSVTPAP